MAFEFCFSVAFRNGMGGVDMYKVSTKHTTTEGKEDDCCIVS